MTLAIDSAIKYRATTHARHKLVDYTVLDYSGTPHITYEI